MIIGSMKMDDRFGMVGNEFVMDYSIDDCSVVVYTVMKTMMYDFAHECSVVSLSSLYELLSVDGKQGPQTKKIKDAITYLIENGYIQMYDMFHNKIEFDTKSSRTYKVSFIDGIEDVEGGWMGIPKHNLCLLLEYIAKNRGINKYKLIRYYLVIARRCNNNENFGFVAQNSLCKVGVSETTCTDWNMILKKLGIIDFNNEYGHIRNGVFKMDCTMYGHYNVVMKNHLELTEDIFNNLVKQRVETNKVKKVDKQAMASKKSIAMKKVWEERKSALQDDTEPVIVEKNSNQSGKVEDTRDSVDRAIDEINDFFGNDTEDNEDLCVGGTYDDYCNDTVTDVQDKDSSFIDAFNEFNDTLQRQENERKKKVYDSMMNTFMRIISNEDIDAWVEEELKDVIVPIKDYKSVSLSMIITAEMKFNKLLKENDLVA